MFILAVPSLVNLIIQNVVDMEVWLLQDPSIEQDAAGSPLLAFDAVFLVCCQNSCQNSSTAFARRMGRHGIRIVSMVAVIKCVLPVQFGTQLVL